MSRDDLPWATNAPSTSAPRSGAPRGDPGDGEDDVSSEISADLSRATGASSTLRAALAARRARQAGAKTTTRVAATTAPRASPPATASVSALSANDENSPPVPNAVFAGSTLRERAALAARAKAELDSDRVATQARRDGEFAEAEALIHDQIVTQRALRKPQGRGGLADREISEEVALRATKLETAQNTSAQSKNSKENWRTARTAITVRRATIHLSNVHNDRWVDVDALFSYYDATYFEGKLSDVSFTWVNRGTDADTNVHDTNDFRYCMCSAVPGWWHGSHKELMCGVACNVERQRGGVARRTAHVQMPDAMRKFKLTKQTKETLLHAMTHCFLFLTGVTKEHEQFYGHNERFRGFTHKLNNDSLTFDVFRPDGGYSIMCNDSLSDDKLDVDELLKQETVDSLTVEHFKILYLVSKYSKFAERTTDPETWVRYQPLLVLMYECIVSGAFEYDYAPQSQMVRGRRIFMNVTQEGRDHLEDLVESKFIRALRTITEDKQPVVAYQITEAGMETLVNSKSLKKIDRRVIDEVIRDPEGGLLSVSYDTKSETFSLRSAYGFCFDSAVTETEDVSYVSSPYLPFTCRDLKRPMASNAHRAFESGSGSDTVKDELDVQITVSRLVILVGEWVPFGCNQIMALTKKLGAGERIKGGYFSSHVDDKSTETCIEIPVGLTKVAVNSCDASSWINIEAEVEFPEDEGITQVENFGIRYQRDGTCLYGLKLEAVMDKILNDISLDYLARVMTDIHIDSSKVTESLTSERQSTLLKMVFNGNEMNRNKVNVFICEKITPKLRALRYLDGDALEAELKQVIGDTQHAFDISENDVVIFGSAGVLFAGPECIQHETLLLAFLALKAREDFVANFFNRLFLVSEQAQEQRRLIHRHHEDPNFVNQIRNSLATINEDCIMMEEIMRNLETSVEAEALPEDRLPSTKAGKRLYHILQIPKMEASLRGRIADCEKQVSATRHEISFLSEQIANVTRALREQVNRDTKHLFKASSEQMKLNDTAASRDVMQLIFAGSLSFGIIDRFTGEWSVVWDNWFKESLQYTLVLNSNAGFFYVSLSLWIAVGVFVLAYMRTKRDKIVGSIHFLARLDVRVNVPKLYSYLKRRNIQREEIVALNHADAAVVRAFTYFDDGSRAPTRVGDPPIDDLWDGYRPTIVLTLDTRNGVLRSAEITCVKPRLEPARVFPRELRERLIQDLKQHDVLLEFESVHRFGDSSMTRQSIARRKGNADVDDASSDLVLFVKRPTDLMCREVVVPVRDLASLTESVAQKFNHKPEHLITLTVSTTVDDGFEIEEVLEDDQQVQGLNTYAKVEVRFRGKPDPGMASFAARVRAVNRARAAGVSSANLFDETDGKNPKGFVGSDGNLNDADFDSNAFDVDDLLYGVGVNGAR